MLSFILLRQKKTDSGEIQVQSTSASEKDAERKALNAAHNFLLVVSKEADPNNEVVQTLLNGANTLLSLAGKNLGNGGEIQSINDEVKRALLNLVVSFFSLVREVSNNTFGEAQFANNDEFHRTLLNVAKTLFSVMWRNTNPKDDFSRNTMTWSMQSSLS